MRYVSAAALVVLLLNAGGCKSPKKNGFFQGPVEPTIAGEWDGSLQMGSTPASAAMSLNQSHLDVTGRYLTPPLSGLQLGDEGTVRGLTTGQSFELTLQATTPGCVANITLNGFNSGPELAFNFTGVDCSCTTVSGQGYAQRPS